MKTALPPELLSYQAATTDIFAAYDDVCLAVLYGSHARRTAGPLSDVDVAVLLERPVDPALYFERRLDLIGRLMQALNTNEVDVVILNQAPLALQYRVVRDGVVLYARHHDHLIEFMAQTVSRYLDFKPVIERHERAILARARQGDLLNGYNPHRGALERYRQLRERTQGTADPDVR
jgi:predicted nucleotidyltransferase